MGYGGGEMMSHETAIAISVLLRGLVVLIQGAVTIYLAFQIDKLELELKTIRERLAKLEAVK